MVDYGNCFRQKYRCISQFILMQEQRDKQNKRALIVCNYFLIRTLQLDGLQLKQNELL
jgi:hypothetical protein